MYAYQFVGFSASVRRDEIVHHSLLILFMSDKWKHSGSQLISKEKRLKCPEQDSIPRFPANFCSNWWCMHTPLWRNVQQSSINSKPVVPTYWLRFLWPSLESDLDVHVHACGVDVVVVLCEPFETVYMHVLFA